MSLLDSIKRRGRPLICPFEPILDAIPANSAVFDIGCGSGFLLGLVAEQKAPRSLAGAEIDPALVDEARKYLEPKAGGRSVSIECYDGSHFPPEIGSANVVLLVDVLHHIPAEMQFAFLKHIHGAMQPSATLILKDIDAARPILCLANKLHDLVVTGKPGHELSKTETKHMLESLSFRVDGSGERVKLWYPHYWFLSIKA
jgi:2-polyprenyl-3-methyl-5-hydroxy-6-metoxy-1,4-benzoquinol methylase